MTVLKKQAEKRKLLMYGDELWNGIKKGSMKY